MAQTQPGLDDRHRDKDGKINRKHGNTLIGTLRETYGSNFAHGESDRAKLADVLHRLDEPSLRQLIKNVHGWSVKKAPTGVIMPGPVGHSGPKRLRRLRISRGCS